MILLTFTNWIFFRTYSPDLRDQKIQIRTQNVGFKGHSLTEKVDFGLWSPVKDNGRMDWTDGRRDKVFHSVVLKYKLYFLIIIMTDRLLK